jgi:hypothetical protein
VWIFPIALIFGQNGDLGMPCFFDLAVKIHSFLKYNVDYIYGFFFFLIILLCYVLVAEGNVSFDFWSMFKSHS